MENIKYLEIIMTGIKLITVSEFYEYFDELQSGESDKLPLFLYSFNLIDKYEFGKMDGSNTTVEIKNITQNTHTKLNIGEYLLKNTIYQKDVFELSKIVDSDIRVETSERELVIYAAGDLKEYFTVIMNDKLDVEYAIKELLCESWCACGRKFVQIINNVENWSDVNYIINSFSNVHNDIEIREQDKELVFKSIYSIVKNMKYFPESGKFGVSLLTEFLKLLINKKDINVKIKEKIVSAFIQSQEEALLKNEEEEELIRSFYINIHLEKVYNRIYTVKKSEKKRFARI